MDTHNRDTEHHLAAAMAQSARPSRKLDNGSARLRVCAMMVPWFSLVIAPTVVP